MDIKDKLVELLQKETLSAEDENALNKIIQNDSEANDFYLAHNKIKAAFKSEENHINEDDLADYLLVKNENEPADKNIYVQIPAIEQHIRECALCKAKLQEFNEEYSEIETALSTELSQTKNNISDNPVENKIIYRKPFYSKYMFVGILLAAFAYGGLFIFSQITTSSTYDSAVINNNDDLYITRGRGTEYFQKSLSALDDKDYSKTIEYLKDDIEANPKDETIFYSYYILGLTYLETAPKNFIGLFPAFNETKVEEGITNLKESIKLNNSGKYENINLDSYFYLGKASLMKKDNASAKKYFTIVIQKHGSKMDEAKVILSELD